MDNQHELIEGYRDLNEGEIEAMNRLKLIEKDVLRILTELPNPDGRWLAIGKTHIQQGFMAAVRSIAKPENEV